MYYLQEDTIGRLATMHIWIVYCRNIIARRILLVSCMFLVVVEWHCLWNRCSTTWIHSVNTAPMAIIPTLCEKSCRQHIQMPKPSRVVVQKQRWNGDSILLSELLILSVERRRNKKTWNITYITWKQTMAIKHQTDSLQPTITLSNITVIR